MQTKELLKSARAELLGECCLNFSRLKLFPNTVQVQTLPPKARDCFFPLLVFFYKSHSSVSALFKFIKIESGNFWRQVTSPWVHKKKWVFVFFFSPSVPCIYWTPYRVSPALHTHTSSSRDNAVMISMSSSISGWASERVSYLPKVTQLESGRAGNPTVVLFFVFCFLNFQLFIVLAGSQQRGYSQAPPRPGWVPRWRNVKKTNVNASGWEWLLLDMTLSRGIC